MGERKQCKKCPWKVGVDPYDIPDGYCAIKHANLKNTIAVDACPGTLDAAMACHESPPKDEIVCIGWLHNQLGVGNNIPLRLAIALGDRRFPTDYTITGPQHNTFEDTLPKE